jgi:hypothetical protein
LVEAVCYSVYCCIAVNKQYNLINQLMKNNVTKIIHLSLFAAALLAMPALVRAQDAKTDAAPASDQATTAKHKTHGTIPFHGKLTDVDTSAKTLAVGNRTFEITAGTKIYNNGEPANLSDGKVGEPVRGTYQKTESGKLEALTVHFGAKTGEKPKSGSSNGH